MPDPLPNVDLGDAPVGTPPDSQKQAQLRSALGLPEEVAPLVGGKVPLEHLPDSPGAAAPLVTATPSATYTLGSNIPAGDYEVNDRITFHITPTGNQNLALGAGILVPSDSAITFPKTLTGGQLYIAQLTYSGSAWLLTSLVGGYA